jgi:hypothetical protein
MGELTIEAIASLKGGIAVWNHLKLSKRSKTFQNSVIVARLWEDLLQNPEEFTILHRFSDNTCFVFRQMGNEFVPLPALFKLELNLTVVEFIHDVGVLNDIGAWALNSGKFDGTFWRLK